MNHTLARGLASTKEKLTAVAPFRALFLAGCLLKAAWYRVTGNEFEAADATLRYSRIVSNTHPDVQPPAVIRQRNAGVVRRCIREAPSNYLLAAYSVSAEAERYRREFEAYGLEHARA